MYCSRCGTEVENSAKFCPSCGLDLAANTPLGRANDEPTAESELELVQDALKNEYEIQQELGRGGMAIVFQARDKQLDREVAVKVLPFSLAFDKEFVERFQREARTAAKLEHPHIIPIYRVGKSGRVIYFVMKFIRGGCLSDQIERRGKVPPDEIKRLLIQTAGALGYAHKHGIVHRDIKPDNIMFDVTGHTVVADFGIAKAASGTRLTGTGMSIGTPHYMSPEQARAQSLDGRSDIYSLGVVAYQCLTGSVPYDGEDAFAIGYKHIMEELPSPPLGGNEERQLYRVIKKMMAKSPDDRFQSAEELIAVLEGRATVSLPKAPEPTVSGDAPTIALPSVAGEFASTPPGQRTGSAALERPSTPTTPMPRQQPRPAPPPKKKRGGALVAASLLVLLGGGGAGGYYYYTNYLEPRGGLAVLLGGAGEPETAAPAQPADGVPAVPADSAAGAGAVARDTMGYLTVAGIPEGGRWYLEGEQAFRATDTVRLEPRTYSIQVKAAGYQTYSTNAVVSPGDTLVVEVAPERIVRREPPPPQPVCDDPNSQHYNLNSACFDRAPRLQGSPILPLAPEVQTDQPTPVVVLVHVSEDGHAIRVAPLRQSSDPQFTIQAVTFARSATYQPATKDGRPVAAWFQLQLAGQRQ